MNVKTKSDSWFVQFTLSAYVTALDFKGTEKQYYNKISELMFHNIIKDEDKKKFESLSNEIVSCARKICEYEAMTFLPDDFKEDYINVSNCIKNIIDNLKTCIRVKVDFLLENQWRIWLGILDCFIEWCVENKFATFSIEKQKELLIESPLMTFLYFID